MSLRVLHTADWHLGDRLGGLDRFPDQIERLEELMAHAEDNRVDVMLVCGDVLEESRPQRLAPIVSEVARLLQPSIERGMRCIFIAGNHDSRHTFDLLEGIQRLLAGDVGRVHFIGSPALLELTAGGKPAAALVALPYPTATAYGVDAQVTTLELKRAALQQAVSDRIEQLATQADAELPGVPKLMAGHFLVREAPADTTGVTEVAEAEDVRVESPRVADFAYVALGHVHEPTVMSERVRYSGALDRVDFGEAGQPRHAVLVEISADGSVTQKELGLRPTPMAHFDVGTLADIAEKAELLEDRERTIVKLALRLGHADSASLWLAEARDRFPRLFKPPALIQLDDPQPALITGEVESADVGQTVRKFLAGELEDDPDRDELLALADELLAAQSREHA